MNKDLNIANIGCPSVTYDPIRVLKMLFANVGYNAGYVIRLGEYDSHMFKQIRDCIDYHEGRDTDLRVRKNDACF